MASNIEYPNLYPDWSNQSFIGEIPPDLEDVQPFNPNFPNSESHLTREASIADIDQHTFSNYGEDIYVGFNMAVNNTRTNGEVVFTRSPSSSPGGLQYYDLQNAEPLDQWESFNLQQHALDTASNFNLAHSPSQSYSLFPSEGISLPQLYGADSGVVGPSRFGFVGEPGNNGALGLSEPSFSSSGSWQDHLNKLIGTPGLSTEAVPCHSQMEASSLSPQASGDESSSSSSSHSNSSCQGSLFSNRGRQGKKRNRLPTTVFNALSDEQKSARKREQERISSKKYADLKRTRELHVQQDFDALTLRRTDLQGVMFFLQKRKQVLEEARRRIGG